MAANDDKKKSIILRISPKLWQDLTQWAEDDFRSLNGQIEYLLTSCVQQRKRTDKNKNDEMGTVPDLTS